MPKPGSLYAIMREHGGERLYVSPNHWIDLHARLLAASFSMLLAILDPVPKANDIPGQLKAFDKAKIVVALNTLFSSESSPVSVSNAIKCVILTFFSNTLSPTMTDARLDLDFGDRVVENAVGVSCIWKRRRHDTSSAPTLPSASSLYGREESAPIPAYIGRSQLASLRHDRYAGCHKHANSLGDPVVRLLHLRSKPLLPTDVYRDPDLVTILLAMAQARFDTKSQSRLFNLRLPFHHIKVQVIPDDTHSSTPNSVVYTAVVTVTFLGRFMSPHKAPKARDGSIGMETRSL